VEWCTPTICESIDLRPCQHDGGYIDGRSQIKVHTDERTKVNSAQSSLTVTHPSTNWARRFLTFHRASIDRHRAPDNLRDVYSSVINSLHCLQLWCSVLTLFSSEIAGLTDNNLGYIRVNSMKHRKPRGYNKSFENHRAGIGLRLQLDLRIKSIRATVIQCFKINIDNGNLNIYQCRKYA